MSPITNKIIYFDSLSSTNDYLISLYKEFNLNHEYVVVANHQLKGRGRRNKSWFSSEDSLIFSFSFKLQDNLNSWTLSMSVSLALIRLLSNYDIQCVIKYPNDILFKNNKIAGILSEIISVKKIKYCIVGVGLNANNKSFPEEIKNATSIFTILNKNVNKDFLLRSFFTHLETLLLSNELSKQYISKLYGFKKFIPCLYKGSFTKIQILEINNSGFLNILTQDSLIKTVSYEDVRFLVN